MGLFKRIARVVKKVAPLAAGFVPVVGPALSIGLKVRSAALAAKRVRTGFIRAKQARRRAAQPSPFMGQASQFAAVRRRVVRRPTRRVYRRRRR